MSNFTTIAPKYQQTAVLQKSASEQLSDMLAPITPALGIITGVFGRKFLLTSSAL